MKKLTAVPVLMILVSACATYQGNETLLEPPHVAAATAVHRSVALGVTDFRVERGLEAICVGSLAPSTVWGDYQEMLTRQMSGTAPVVVDARECYRDDATQWRLRADDTPAVRISATDIEWWNSDTGLSRVYVEVNLKDRFTYDVRVVNREDRWVTDDVYCNRGENGLCVAIRPEVSG